MYGLLDPVLSQIVTTLAQEIEVSFDRIVVESLGIALCILIAERFVGPLQLPASNKGLSPERLRRVRTILTWTSRSLSSPTSPV